MEQKWYRDLKIVDMIQYISSSSFRDKLEIHKEKDRLKTLQKAKESEVLVNWISFYLFCWDQCTVVHLFQKTPVHVWVVTLYETTREYPWARFVLFSQFSSKDEHWILSGLPKIKIFICCKYVFSISMLVYWNWRRI